MFDMRIILYALVGVGLGFHNSIWFFVSKEILKLIGCVMPVKEKFLRLSYYVWMYFQHLKNSKVLCFVFTELGISLLGILYAILEIITQNRSADMPFIIFSYNTQGNLQPNNIISIHHLLRYTNLLNTMVKC